MKKIILILMFVNFISNAQWVEMSNGIENVGGVFTFSYSGNNFFAGTGLFGVYVTTNNGINWVQTSLNDRDVHSLAVNGIYTFAGTGVNGVFKSINNGTNWTQTPLNNQSIRSIAVNGNNIFAGVIDLGVYLTTNNGISWTQTSLNNRSVVALAVNGNNIYAGTLNYGVYLSTNNGTSWSQTPLNNRNISALVVNGDNIFAGTYNSFPFYGVYLSSNNGASWTQTSLNNQNVSSLAVSGNNIFAGSIDNGFYVSNNNGVSWLQRNEGLGTSLINTLCILNNYIFAGTYGYSVYRRSLGELIGIQPVSNEIPNTFLLSQNYPNPFNPATNIKFALPESGFVKLTVFDMLGREIETLVNKNMNAGTYNADWDAANYSSGVYFYRLHSGKFSEIRKMVLIK